MTHILTYLVFIPLIGACAMLLMALLKKGDYDNSYKWIAVITTGVQLLLTILLVAKYEPSNGIQFIEQYSWIPQFNIEYFMGVDGLSMPMIFLTSLLSFICVISSWNINRSVLGYFSLFLLIFFHFC